MSIENRLKEARMERGMSRAELSRRSNISAVTIMSIENGRSTPRIDTVSMICDALNLNPSGIFFDINLNHSLSINRNHGLRINENHGLRINENHG